jgi:hypothetical protein
MCSGRGRRDRTVIVKMSNCLLLYMWGQGGQEMTKTTLQFRRYDTGPDSGGEPSSPLDVGTGPVGECVMDLKLDLVEFVWVK